MKNEMFFLFQFANFSIFYKNLVTVSGNYYKNGIRYILKDIVP